MAGANVVSPEMAREAERICAFSNLSLIAGEVTQYFNRALSPSGVNIQQAAYLVCIRASEDPTVASIARKKRRDRASLTRTLKVMEDEGWLELVPAAGQGHRVKLTRAGIARLSAAATLWHRAQAELMRDFGAESWEDAVDGFSRLQETIDRLR